MAWLAQILRRPLGSTHSAAVKAERERGRTRRASRPWRACETQNAH